MHTNPIEADVPGTRSGYSRVFAFRAQQCSRRRCYRLLRRRDLGQTELPAELPEVGVEAEPWRDAARNESHAGLLARVRALPQPLREVVVLHYLRGCPQREVAAFLDLPATTVNNRMHLARRLLKGKTMNFEIPEAGCVLRVAGPVADVRFSPDAQPDVFDALSPARAKPNLRVLQDLGDGVVRCVVVGGDAPAVGQDVLNRTASGGTYAAAVPEDERLESIVATLGDECVGFWETGIKSVDFLCPLPERGNVALFGTAGTGKMTLTVELRHRIPAQGPSLGPKLFYLADRSEPSLVRDLREEIRVVRPRRRVDPERPRDRSGVRGDERVLGCKSVLLAVAGHPPALARDRSVPLAFARRRE